MSQAWIRSTLSCMLWRSQSLSVVLVTILILILTEWSLSTLVKILNLLEPLLRRNQVVIICLNLIRMNLVHLPIAPHLVPLPSILIILRRVCKHTSSIPSNLLKVLMIIPQVFINDLLHLVVRNPDAFILSLVDEITRVAILTTLLPVKVLARV